MNIGRDRYRDKRRKDGAPDVVCMVLLFSLSPYSYIAFYFDGDFYLKIPYPIGPSILIFPHLYNYLDVLSIHSFIFLSILSIYLSSYPSSPSPFPFPSTMPMPISSNFSLPLPTLFPSFVFFSSQVSSSPP